MSSVRLAIVGCGAVTASIHLPSLQGQTGVAITTLVDSDLSKARALGKQFGVGDCLTDYTELQGRVDGALVALPNALHRSVTCDLLEMGLPVMVEKPMANVLSDCEQMQAVAQKVGLPLAVGLIWRKLRWVEWVAQLLESKTLGELESISLEFGSVFNWPVTSPAFFDRALSGGGVLLDMGVHLLDLLYGWLGDGHVEHYQDDAKGGVESEGMIQLAYPKCARVEVRLSRSRQLANKLIIRAQRGRLEVGLGALGPVRLVISGSDGEALERSFQDSFLQAGRRQILEFAELICRSKEPASSCQRSIHVMRTIFNCYEVRQSLHHPWEES